MKKVVTIIDYFDQQLKEYISQLCAAFEDSIHVRKLLVSELENGNAKLLHDSELIIFPSYSLYYEVKNYIPKDNKTLIFERTITREGYCKLKKYEEKNNIYLVDETKYMASEMYNIINKLGNNKFNLIPCSIETALNIENGIILNLGHNINNNKCKVVNIGRALLSVCSIVEMSVILNEKGNLIEKDIKNAYKETISYNKGFLFLLNEVNKFTSRSESFIDYIEEGYIILNKLGNVEDYNSKAEYILSPLTKNIKEYDVMSLFSTETRDKAFNNKRKIINELIDIEGRIVVAHIYPTVSSEKFYGTVVIIREFNEVEKRQHEIRKKIVGKGHRAKYSFNDIKGESIELKTCIENAKKMSLSSSSVLIEGETGTGKELFAQAIHNYSYRSNYGFVAVNCGALPSSILESELFGYEEGAFTGAKKGGKLGLFELAHKGTIFLDEIGEMPIELQTKLLRVLQEKEVMRIGSDRIISIDIRVIAATNKNLYELVKLKKFREDLFYRLKVLPLKIPPLRSRRNDILILFKYFIRYFNGKIVLSEDAKEKLVNYEWRGNVRELCNISEFCVNTGKKVIDRDDLLLEAYDINQYNNVNDNYIHDNYKEDTLAILKDIAGMEKDKYFIVLEILYNNYMQKKRIGRRNICVEARNRKITITEQQVRRILNELERLKLVRINIGRKGSEITIKGIKVLERI